MEELVDGMGSKGMFKMSFIMDDVLCTGDFRKREADRLLQGGHDEESVEVKSPIDTEKLWKDYGKFVEEEKEYFERLSAHLEENEDYREDIFLTSVFNDMVVFLMEKENSLDDYLIGAELPEVIYNFYKMNTYHEYYFVNGADMNPLSVFRMNT